MAALRQLALRGVLYFAGATHDFDWVVHDLSMPNLVFSIIAWEADAEQVAIPMHDLDVLPMV